MAGDLPTAVHHRGAGRAHALILSILSAALLGAICAASSTAGGSTGIDFGANAIGAAPQDFDFGITGRGQPGRWTTVNDATAGDGAAVAQSDTDPTEGRLVFAVYRPLSLKNFRASIKLKFVRGTMPSAGIAFRFSDANNVVSANALEGRVDVWRVADGKKQRIDGSEAEVAFGQWHTLEIIAQGDALRVAFDDDWLSTFDRTFTQDGRLGLWTEEDTLTRFALADHHRLAGVGKALKETEMRRFRAAARFGILPRTTGTGAALRENDA